MAKLCGTLAGTCACLLPLGHTDRHRCTHGFEWQSDGEGA